MPVFGETPFRGGGVGGQVSGLHWQIPTEVRLVDALRIVILVSSFPPFARPRLRPIATPGGVQHHKPKP
jgi:hypothetical protein